MDEVTLQRWRGAGLTKNSARLPQILGRLMMNQLPVRMSRSRPHEHPGFDVLGRFPRGRRSVLWRLFPAAEMRLGYEAGRFIRRLALKDATWMIE